MTWENRTFLIATSYGQPSETCGYTYKGLGLFLVATGSPKGRRPPKWSLTHINSGHRIAVLSGSLSDVQRIGARVADAADWSFINPDGWKNQEPDLPIKTRDALAVEPKRIVVGLRIGMSDPSQARAIAGVMA